MSVEERGAGAHGGAPASTAARRGQFLPFIIMVLMAGGLVGLSLGPAGWLRWLIQKDSFPFLRPHCAAEAAAAGRMRIGSDGGAARPRGREARGRWKAELPVSPWAPSSHLRHPPHDPLQNRISGPTPRTTRDRCHRGKGTKKRRNFYFLYLIRAFTFGRDKRKRPATQQTRARSPARPRSAGLRRLRLSMGSESGWPTGPRPAEAGLASRAMHGQVSHLLRWRLMPL